MLIELLLSRNLPFVIYRLPHSSEIVIAVQTKGNPAEFELEKLDKQKGFVLAPFDTYKNGKATLINPSRIAKTDQEKLNLKNELLRMPEVPLPQEEETQFVVGKTEYLRQANYLIDRMKSGMLKKVVLSRVIAKPLFSGFDYDEFFNQLDEKYASAFVYLFYLPGKGVWAGATPETLIEKKNDVYETMALAGTQIPEEGAGKVVWQEKEIEEQHFVSEFIAKQLKKSGIKTYKRLPEETIRAGKLAHICTLFRIPESEMAGKAGNLVKVLHPTPAVCGLPRGKAWNLILETEKHSRGFYTGFLGPWNLDDGNRLFVNLRCGRFYQLGIELYVGGGLTAQSVAEDEWQETEDKSRTLLSLVENLRNFAP